jgi:imidazolonepropionase-like amidohydrolase
MLTNNLRLLRDAGVRIAIGSDRYRMTSAPEIPALRSLGIFSDTALIRMWSMDTPREIFPDRKIGSLDGGSEASFLVLDGNPLTDFSALGRIRMRMKQGVILGIH